MSSPPHDALQDAQEAIAALNKKVTDLEQVAFQIKVIGGAIGVAAAIVLAFFGWSLMDLPKKARDAAEAKALEVAKLEAEKVVKTEQFKIAIENIERLVKNAENETGKASNAAKDALDAESGLKAIKKRWEDFDYTKKFDDYKANTAKNLGEALDKKLALYTTVAFKEIDFDATNHRDKGGYVEVAKKIDFAKRVVKDTKPHVVITGFYIRGNDSKIGEINVDIRNVRVEGDLVKFEYALNMHDDTPNRRLGKIRAIILAQTRPGE